MPARRAGVLRVSSGAGEAAAGAGSLPRAAAAAKIAAPPQIQMDRMPIMRRSYSIPSGGATSNAPASSRLP